MLKLWLIRHGQTEGNRLSRYIGVTDEPLCPEGREFLGRLDYPRPEEVYISPLRRCAETAQLLFPENSLHIIDELAECDFGEFENKNYKELSGNSNYQAWVDSGGTLPFPGGESRETFRRRSCKGIQRAVTGCIRHKTSYAAVVAHGGTIMNIMEEYADVRRPFYEWHVRCGGGYEIEIDERLWQEGRGSFKFCAALLQQ